MKILWDVSVLFSIGDKIVYPMHGAGTIEAIEEKEFLGNRKHYYVMNLSVGEMKVMIPMDRANRLGLRQIIGQEELAEVYRVIKGNDGACSSQNNWNRRYMVNMEKIKSGNILEVAEVYRTLKFREMEKGLSTGEKKMLESVKRILLSELVLVQGEEEEEINEKLEAAFK